MLGSVLRIPQKGEFWLLIIFPINILESLLAKGPVEKVYNGDQGLLGGDSWHVSTLVAVGQQWPTANSSNLELAKLDAWQLQTQRESLHLKQKRENCLNASIFVIEAIAHHFTCQLADRITSLSWVWEFNYVSSVCIFERKPPDWPVKHPACLPVGNCYLFLTQEMSPQKRNLLYFTKLAHPITKLDKESIEKENYRPILSMNINAKFLNKIQAYEIWKYNIRAFPLKTEARQYVHYDLNYLTLLWNIWPMQ